MPHPAKTLDVALPDGESPANGGRVPAFLRHSPPPPVSSEPKASKGGGGGGLGGGAPG